MLQELKKNQKNGFMKGNVTVEIGIVKEIVIGIVIANATETENVVDTEKGQSLLLL